MKKQLLLPTLLLCITATAQPVITSDVLPGVGGSYGQVDFDADGFDVGDAGAGVTWDFSSMALGSDVSTLSVVDVESAPSGILFSDANQAWTNDAISYNFFSLTSSALEFWGTVSEDVDLGSIVIPYDDSEVLFALPVTYLDENVDDFSASFSLTGFDVERSGTTTMEADAYGTLILPTGTFTDVLRVKVTQEYGDLITFLGLSTEYVFEQYYWLKAGVSGPVMQYVYAYIDALGTITEEEIGYVNESLVDIQYADELPFSIYPNPASDDIILQLNQIDGEVGIRIINMLGQTCFNEQLVGGAATSVDISNLEAGNYLLSVTTLKGTSTQIFQVK